MKNTPA